MGWAFKGDNYQETILVHNDIVLEAVWQSFEDSITYTVINNEVTLLNYDGNARVLVLPESLEGLPIKKIGAEAFMYQETIEHLKISSFVTTIEDRAFKGMTALKTVIFANETQTFGNDVLTGADQLVEITLSSELDIALNALFGENDQAIPAGLAKIHHALGGAFIDGTMTKSFMNEATLYMASDVTAIANDTFRNGIGLKHVIILASVQTIGRQAFSSLANLKSVTIPISVIQIQEDAFSSTHGLTVYAEAPSRPSEWHLYWAGSWFISTIVSWSHPRP